jgi:hypothetical protein
MFGMRTRVEQVFDLARAVAHLISLQEIAAFAKSQYRTICGHDDVRTRTGLRPLRRPRFRSGRTSWRSSGRQAAKSFSSCCSRDGHRNHRMRWYQSWPRSPIRAEIDIPIDRVAKKQEKNSSCAARKPRGGIVDRRSIRHWSGRANRWRSSLFGSRFRGGLFGCRFRGGHFSRRFHRRVNRRFNRRFGSAAGSIGASVAGSVPVSSAGVSTSIVVGASSTPEGVVGLGPVSQPTVNMARAINMQIQEALRIVKPFSKRGYTNTTHQTGHNIVPRFQIRENQARR